MALSPEIEAAKNLGYDVSEYERPPPRRRKAEAPPAPELGEFLAMEFPPDEPILGAFSKNQIGQIIGPTGLGKTMFAVQLIRGLVCGRTIFGWRSHRRVPVLLVDGEMGGGAQQSRFGQYTWPDDREPLQIVNAINWCSRHGMGHPNFAEKSWQDRLCEWAPEGGVVVFDNTMSLIHVPGTSMSSDEFWRGVTPLNLRLRAMGCTAIWIDHTNAEGRIHGTKTKEWHSDLVLTLMNNEKTPEFEEKPGAAFTLAFTKVRGRRGPEHSTIDVQMTPNEFGMASWSYRPRKQAELELARDLRASGLTQRQIAGEMGISLGKVNKLLRAQSQPANGATYR